MKKYLLFTLATALLCSCAPQKRVLYMQDADPDKQIEMAKNYQIKIKPLDRLTVMVTSKDPALAVPFNTASSYNALSAGPTSSANGAQSLQIRTVGEDGYLQMPIIGEVKCAGKTRSQLAREIADKIIEGGYINDPTVNVQFADMKVSIIGEVARPGQYEITKDRITLLEALSLAGDLTIYGRRDNVAVIRETDGTTDIEYVDLTKTQDIFTSPVFYLQQNDVIYVSPNRYKAATSEINQNRTFWLSLASTAVSVATLVISIISISNSTAARAAK